MRTPSIPKSQKWLVDGFCWYSKSLVRKSFASFGVSNPAPLRNLPADTSVVVYMNHVGWWDPIVGMLIRQWAMPQRTLYAPIDAVQLENYAILKRMGFFGVSLGSKQGASDFLSISRSILAQPHTSLWLTPEGKFCDVRDLSEPLMPGLAHLASKIPGLLFLPIAVEYTFWSDAQPHVLCRIGQPIRFSGDALGPSTGSESRTLKSERGDRLTAGLRETQRELAELAIARDSGAFEYLLASRPARLSWYDFVRSCVAKARGRKFDPRHSASMGSADISSAAADSEPQAAEGLRSVATRSRD